jgi:crotonobetainyl-CoA:carnitine CoA-transferase CaiB-like acyl-CoA transferase
MLLADEGAEVVKVEPPKGELTRAREPIRTSDSGSMSGYFGALNRRKSSIAIDLKSEAGIALLHQLLAKADVFISNMRPQALDRLGIHPETLRDRYPSLIIASMTGFGLANAGADENRAGLAMVAEALAGTNGLARDREGRPVWCGFALGDIVTGMTAHAAILLALRNRDQTGEGRLIDLALPDSTLPLTSVALARVQAADVDYSAIASSNDFHGVPYGTFAASDGFYNIGVNRDDFWVRLCSAMGRPELGHDPRYATYIERAKRQAEVHALLENWSIGLPRDVVVAALTDADVPVAPVLDMAEVLELEHFRARGVFVEVDDGIGGTLTQPTDPTGFAIGGRPRVPHLGEQRDTVLGEVLGLGAEQIESLAAAGAFGAVGSHSGNAASATAAH